jgi:hypothetical protein
VFVVFAFLDIVHILPRPSGTSFRSNARLLGTSRFAFTIGATSVIRLSGGAGVIPAPRRTSGIIRAAGTFRLAATDYCFCADARTGRPSHPNRLLFVERFRGKPQERARRFSQGVP